MTDTPHIDLPDFCLAVLIGAPNSGKSDFAARHFAADEIVPGRRLSGTPNDREVAEIVAAAEARLKARELTVVDAPNGKDLRRALVALANRTEARPVAITFDVGLDEAQMRAAAEGSPPSRSAHAHLIQAVRDYRPGKDGFRRFWRLERGEAETATVGRAPLPMDRRSDRGPFDVVGDVHGCADELVDLLRKLGYEVSFSGGKAKLLAPHGRKVVLLGDLVDRGPKTPDALRIAMAVAEAGGYVVKGNHEHKLHRALTGHTVALNNGLTRSIEQISAEPPAFRKTACDFIDGLLTHYWLDGGNLAVAHAGVTAEMLGRSSLTVDQFNLYGFPTGETDAATGAPARKDWALGYDGAPHVVYGHTAHLEPEWVNRTLCVDTGCVFGGELTALRWPENELVSVPARQVYSPYHGTLTTRRDQLPQDRAGTPSI